MASDQAPSSPSGLSLDPVALASLASLTLRARVIVEGAFSGMHHNLHAGTSMEFTEHKEYAPGDEIRRIDWKAAGRVDRYYVKRFEDETEMRTFLVVDASASMGYAPCRRHQAHLRWLPRQLARLSAGAAGRSRRACCCSTSGPATTCRPAPGPDRFGRSFDCSRPRPPPDAPQIERVFTQLGELTDKRSLVIVFSDLLDAEELGRSPSAALPGRPERPGARGQVAERLANLVARGHDVVVFHLLDADEIELPFEDLMFFEGMEPGDARSLLAEASELRQAFRDESLAFRERWRRACIEIGVEYRFTRTDAPPAEVLRAFLGGRRRAGRR